VTQFKFITSPTGNPIPQIRPARQSQRNSPVVVCVVTLGCVRNTVDSENLAATLMAGGATMVGEPAEADTVIVNTCGFIGPAQEESRDVIRELVTLKETTDLRLVLVMGCLVERQAEQLTQDVPGVDGFYALSSAREIAADIGLASPRDEAGRAFSSTGHYAYLKISEGCDYRCSFCVIPSIRGPHRSRPLADIVAEAQRLADNGVQELILVAEDTAYYGTDLADDIDLCNVLRALNVVDGLAWIRVMYLHPARTTQLMLDTVAELDGVVPYLDIPMQHVSTPVLQRMRRQSTEEMLYDLVERMRNTIPGVALRTTFLVGYPGETEEDFARLEQFVKDAAFDRMGVFTYSPEEGSPAFQEEPRVPVAIMQERMERLMIVQQELALEKNRELIGSVIPVIIDEPDEEQGGCIGRTPWDAPDVDNIVTISEPLPEGAMSLVLIEDAEPYALHGSVVNDIEDCPDVDIAPVE
jgi:ribosomal protein S12 methylthiotransferase